MQKLVFVNGNGTQIDFTGGNFGITNWAGLSNVPLNIQTQQVPFEDGGVFLDALMEQREIEVTVAIYDGNNLELRYQKKRELISALNPKLGEGTLIYTNDYLSRQIKAVPQIPLFENKNSNDAGTLKASVVFSCCNPYWEDVEETIVNFDSSEQPIVKNEGDVPVNVELEFATEYVKNATIANVSNGQRIRYDGDLTSYLKINTNAGKKTVYKESYIMGFNSCALQIKNFAYSEKLKLLVAIGSYGLVQRAKDDLKWIGCQSPTTENLLSITYSEELQLFVVGGESSILTSTDGENWTIVFQSTGTGMSAVTYSSEKHKFVGLGNNGEIYISSDGITWTQSFIGHYVSIYDVIYIDDLGMFFACAERPYIFKSIDGENWTEMTFTDNNHYSIAYSHLLHRIIVVGNEIIRTSTDGENWEDVELPESVRSDTFRGVCYSENIGKFIVCSDDGNIIESRDGLNWEITFNEFITRFLNAIYIDELSITLLVGLEGVFFNSVDCVNWNIIKPFNKTINDILYSERLKLFVLVGVQFMGYSYDLQIIYISNNTTAKSVCYSEELQLFVADNALRSTDGKNWL